MATLTTAQPAAHGPASAAQPAGEAGDLAAQFNQRRYRPVGASDLFDDAYDLYRSNFLLFLGAAAVLLVPLDFVIYEFVVPGMTAQIGHVARNEFDPEQIVDLLGKATSYSLGLSLINWIVYVVLSGASTAIASSRYLNRPSQLGSAYKTSLRRTLPLLFCVLLAAVCVAVGLALCIVPGVWIACRFALLAQVAVLEPKLGPFAALRRAWRLTDGHALRVFGVLLLLSVLTSAILVSLRGPIEIAIDTLPIDSIPFLQEVARHRQLSSEITSAVSSLLTTPFIFVTLTALYYDLRIRDEGYDMAILAAQLGFDETAAAAALPHAAAPRPAAATVKQSQRRKR